MTDNLLDLDVRLLLLRHGRKKVLEALARNGERTLQELEQDLAIATARGSDKKKRHDAGSPGLVATLFGHRESVLPVVQTLVTRYENRMLLPQLRDVERFIERTGQGSRPKLKSRKTALGPFLRTVARLSDDDIRRLAESREREASSDYAALAREIMRPK